MTNPPWTHLEDQIAARIASALKQKPIIAAGIDQIKAERIQAIKEAHQQSVVNMGEFRRKRGRGYY